MKRPAIFKLPPAALLAAALAGTAGFCSFNYPVERAPSSAPAPAEPAPLLPAPVQTDGLF